MPPRARRRRGYIEQLPSGSFRAVVFAGSDPLTGQDLRVRTTCPTRGEAEKALTKLQRQVDENKHPKSGITVAAAVQQWMEVAELQETTRDRYEDLIRLYILPRLGQLQVARLEMPGRPVGGEPLPLVRGQAAVRGERSPDPGVVPAAPWSYRPPSRQRPQLPAPRSGPRVPAGVGRAADAVGSGLGRAGDAAAVAPAHRRPADPRAVPAAAPDR